MAEPAGTRVGSDAESGAIARDGNPMRLVDVAVVGGGPAGAAVAVHLAHAGIEVALFERSREPTWRACGVYSSPLTRARLGTLGVTPERIAALVADVPALVVETAGGASARLEYAAVGNACGIDRVALDAELLAGARAAGATVFRAATVRDIRPVSWGRRSRTEMTVSTPDQVETWAARLVIGADGHGSLVARSFGVQRPARRLRRAGITFHLDVGETRVDEAHLVFGRGWYCGICPVPGGRVNIGIVLGEAALRDALRRGGRPEDIARHVLASLPGRWQSLATNRITDHVAVALPLANRVSAAAGTGFLLLGDAAGFIDPVTGEGLHRALVSAALAGEAATASIRGNADALGLYDRRLRARFGRKDTLSWLLQAFLARPEVLGYAVRRLEARPAVRRTFAAVMGDLVRPERALRPTFLAALLRP